MIITLQGRDHGGGGVDKRIAAGEFFPNIR
jgi:hypothetical protein